MAKKYRIPFIYDNMLDYANEWTEKQPGFEWRDVYTFHAILKYTGYQCGRSAIRFNFVDTQTGFRYSMPISCFDEIVPLMSRGQISGNWTFHKKGTAYGIEIVWAGKKE